MTDNPEETLRDVCLAATRVARAHHPRTNPVVALNAELLRLAQSRRRVVNAVAAPRTAKALDKLLAACSVAPSDRYARQRSVTRNSAARTNRARLVLVEDGKVDLS